MKSLLLIIILGILNIPHLRGQDIDSEQIEYWNRGLHLYEEKDSRDYISDKDLCDLINMSISLYCENRHEAAKRGWVDDSFLNGTNVLVDNLPKDYQLADSLTSIYKTVFMRPDTIKMKRNKRLWALQLAKVTGKCDSVALCFAEVAICKKRRSGEKKSDKKLEYGVFYNFHYEMMNGKWLLARKEGFATWGSGGTMVFFP